MPWLAPLHKRSPIGTSCTLQEPYGPSKRSAGQHEVMFQLLCPASRIGHIIGKASQLDISLNGWHLICPRHRPFLDMLKCVLASWDVMYTHKWEAKPCIPHSNMLGHYPIYKSTVCNVGHRGEPQSSSSGRALRRTSRLRGRRPDA